MRFESAVLYLGRKLDKIISLLMSGENPSETFLNWFNLIAVVIGLVGFMMIVIHIFSTVRIENKNDAVKRMKKLCETQK